MRSRHSVRLHRGHLDSGLANLDCITCIAPLQARPEYAADVVLLAADIAFHIEVSSGLGGELVTIVLDRLAVLEAAVQVIV